MPPVGLNKKSKSFKTIQEKEEQIVSPEIPNIIISPISDKSEETNATNTGGSSTSIENTVPCIIITGPSKENSIVCTAEESKGNTMDDIKLGVQPKAVVKRKSFIFEGFNEKMQEMKANIDERKKYVKFIEEASKDKYPKNNERGKKMFGKSKFWKEAEEKKEE